jgi:nicotinamidase-related amidase
LTEERIVSTFQSGVGDPMTDENVAADLLALVLAGRPERLTHQAIGRLPTDVQVAAGVTADTIATLGLAQGPVAPSAALRDRVLASVRARRERPPRRAVLVCDMIRDHLTPGRPLEVPRARAIVPALVERIASARSSGVPIVYVLDRHAPDDPDLDEWGAHAIEGSEGAEVWPDLAPAAGDRVVTKPSYSGFHGSDLERVLDDLAVDTLVVTGCATEVQLLATATDALQRGFALEVPEDTQAGTNETAEKVALRVLSLLAPYAPARRERLARAASRSV